MAVECTSKKEGYKMPWVRIDDKFTDHPKLVSVGPLGIALQIAALCYSNAYLTDGFIQYNIAKRLLCFEFTPPNDTAIYTIGIASGMSGQDVTWEMVAGWLVDAGIWEEVAGGYYIHDYPEYQLLKNDIIIIRDARAAAGHNGGIASGETRRSKNEAKTKQIASDNRSKTPSKNEAKTKPNPNPNPNPKAEEEELPRPLVFTLYERNIGMLTPMICEELLIAEKEYPADWIEKAIQEALNNNVRNWKYVSAILTRWKKDGIGGTNNNGKGKGNGKHEMTDEERRVWMRKENAKLGIE
jgi:DnaD/phage-associated family protein